jgi:hypothetical protein
VSWTNGYDAPATIERIVSNGWATANEMGAVRAGVAGLGYTPGIPGTTVV